jgi:hypothetical protein
MTMNLYTISSNWTQNYNEFSQAWILKTEPVFIGYLTLVITASYNYFQNIKEPVFFMKEPKVL